VASGLVVYYTALPTVRQTFHLRNSHTTASQKYPRDLQNLCLPILSVSVRYPDPWYLPLMPCLAIPQAQHQGQDAEQTSVPVAADPSSPKSLSLQTNVAAQERIDTIDHPSPVTNASTRHAKDDATITVDSADPLGYARHRRENISQKQMKAEHPLAKPRHMKVCHHAEVSRPGSKQP
jgi:hypothetical protein